MARLPKGNGDAPDVTSATGASGHELPSFANRKGARDLGASRPIVVLRKADDRLWGRYHGTRTIAGGPDGTMLLADIDAERVEVAPPTPEELIEKPELATRELPPVDGPISLVCSGAITNAVEALRPGQRCYFERTALTRKLRGGKSMTVYRIIPDDSPAAS